MKIGQKLKVAPPPPQTEILHKKTIEVFKMTKIAIVSKKFAISDSFDEKPSKVG